MTLGEFWEKVTLLCLEFDGSVTSGVRSRNRNANVGGANLSWHQNGLAADIVLDDLGLKPNCLERAKRMFPFVLDEGDHIHLQGDI